MKVIRNEDQYKSKDFFQYFYSDNRYSWYYSLKLSRSSIVSINRCRPNHCHLVTSLTQHWDY